MLVFRLTEAGFDSFAEEGIEFRAYVPKDLFDRDAIDRIFRDYGWSYEAGVLPERNWNSEWEKNFSPVMIAGRCYIRAPFHDPMPSVQFELIIEPKMSFGTAHHETTAMMIETMLGQEIRGQRVLDMGCGTGILAILAYRMGAAQIVAIDNDTWAFTNALENCERNQTAGIIVKQGDAVDITGTFDLILANINRNILLEQIGTYAHSLAQPGKLFMSGFYEEDLPAIRGEAEKQGLHYSDHSTKNGWVAAVFIK